jgi:hypothetical protein
MLDKERKGGGDLALINYTHAQVLYHDNSELENSRSIGYNSSMPKRMIFFRALLILKLSQDLQDQTNRTPS